METPIRPSGATRMATTTLYEHDEWMEITHEVYDFFIMHPSQPDEMLVGPYGFYHNLLGRAFVCIQTDTKGWLTAVSCVNMTQSDFIALSKIDRIDDVIVALGYMPMPTTPTSD